MKTLTYVKADADTRQITGYTTRPHEPVDGRVEIIAGIRTRIDEDLVYKRPIVPKPRVIVIVL